MIININYGFMIFAITALWLAIRISVWIKNKSISLKREAQLILVYICFIVVARYTFFPFEKVNGAVQPLVFDYGKMIPPRINLVPLVHLLDYAIQGEATLNIVGNTTMFIPIGIIWPAVYKELNTHIKVIGAGIGFSLFIEIIQLPFFSRVTDIDDLILNTVGFLAGYGIYLLFCAVKKKVKTNHHKN